MKSGFSYEPAHEYAVDFLSHDPAPPAHHIASTSALGLSVEQIRDENRHFFFRTVAGSAIVLSAPEMMPYEASIVGCVSGALPSTRATNL